MNKQFQTLESQERIDPSAFKRITSNIVENIDVIAKSAEQDFETTRQLKLQNDDFEFRKLANDSITTSYETYKSDSQKLQEEFGKLERSILIGIPIANRQKAQEWYWANTQGYLAKARTNEYNIQADQFKANQLESIDQSLKKIHDFSSAYFNGTPDKKAEAGISLQQTNNKFEEAINATMPDGTPLFTAEQRRAYREKFNKEFVISGVRGGFDMAQNITQKQAYLNSFTNGTLIFEQHNLAGESEVYEVNDFLSRGEFEASRGYMIRDIESDLKNIENSAGVQMVNDVLDGIAQPDPALGIYVKGVNYLYENAIRPEIKNASPKDASETMLNYMKKTQVIPAMMLKELKVWNDSGDEVQLMRAANFISNAKNYFPPFIDKLSDKEYGKALALAEKIDADINPREAITAVNDLYSPVTGEIFQARAKEFDNIIASQKLDLQYEIENALSPFIGGWFRNKFPDETFTSEAAALEFKRIWKNNYEITRDLEKSKQVAIDRIQRFYGPSAATDGKIIYKPPEHFYSIENENPEWIKNQLFEDGKAIIEKMGLNLDPNTLRIQNNTRIHQDDPNTGLPTYIVEARNAAGQYIVIGELGNKPWRWYPDRQKQLNKMEERAVSKRESRSFVTNASSINLAREIFPYLLIKPQTENMKKIMNNLSELFKNVGQKGSFSFPSMTKEELDVFNENFKRNKRQI